MRSFYQDKLGTTIAKVETAGVFRRVISAPPWLNRRMNCSYNNGIMDCMGTCVSADMPPDGEAALRLAAARLQATGSFIPFIQRQNAWSIHSSVSIHDKFQCFFMSFVQHLCCYRDDLEGQCTEQTVALY